MKTVTRRIGLSLGADEDWPRCYEDILAALDLSLPMGGETVRFDVKRVTIEPYDLQKPCAYDLVVDRLTHWYAPTREWIKKAVLMDDLYVLNNPWSVQSMEKHTTYCAMMALGLPIPGTWIVPPKDYEPKADLKVTLERYAELFDLGHIGRALAYPVFMKPYDGGGWVGVSKIDDERALREAYEKSGKALMHVQQGVAPFDMFVRCIGFGPQTTVIRYEPSLPLHQRYTADRDFLSADDRELIEDITLTINAFFGWDFNSCEALLKGGTWHPIDFANPCPDSQVTSLHQHFPWLVKAYLRWSIYCAATQRRMRKTLDWEPFYAVRDRKLPFRERVRAYAAVARERFESARFDAFCAEHLGRLDRVAWEYFGSPRAREAVAAKVRALFPEREWEQFTEHFWQEIQTWRARDEAERGSAAAPASAARASAAKAGKPARK